MLTQSIWFNKKLKFENTTVFFIINGVTHDYFFFINDLLDENNEFLSLNRFKEIYGIEPPFCTVYENFRYDTTNLKIWN